MAVDDFLSVGEAAAIIGCTDGRVRQMLLEGRLKGKKLNSRAWAIHSDEVNRMKEVEYPSGRPRGNDQKNSA